MAASPLTSIFLKLRVSHALHLADPPHPLQLSGPPVLPLTSAATIERLEGKPAQQFRAIPVEVADSSQ
eukprot:6187553-Pleurochrysis_carterae.AAC.1